MTKSAFAFAVLFLAVITLIGFRPNEPRAAENVKVPAQKWEYKVYRTDELNDGQWLNGLGESGWEAVGVAIRSTSNDTEKSVVLFKRQK